MKVVINRCFGGFGLSIDAWKRLDEATNNRSIVGQDEEGCHYCPRIRADPALVQIVEEMGEAAGGPHAELKVIEIPDDVKWYIEEYERQLLKLQYGIEHIAEVHRTWR